MTDKKPDTFDLNQLKRSDLHARHSKITTGHFGRPVPKNSGFRQFFDSLPDILAAADLKKVARAIAKAINNERPVHLSIGAHVLKVGLSPLLIDLFERKIITGLSVNGAVLIHDYEIAAAGKTSEDVDQVLGNGEFGMAEQTGRDLANFISAGAKDGLGLAGSVARGISEGDFPNKDLSLVAAAWKHGFISAHPALGTDIAHLWPDLDWAALGTSARIDFLAFIAQVENFKNAVYLNIGSAVVLPEVFLKAVSAARNTGADHAGLITADFDFIRQYRAQTNVVRRPTENVGTGYSFTGHHEIIIPLLFAAVMEYLGDD